MMAARLKRITLFKEQPVPNANPKKSTGPKLRGGQK
jgi:hypothetical protein